MSTYDALMQLATVVMGATDPVFLQPYYSLPQYSMPTGRVRKHSKRELHLDMLHKHKTVKANRRKAKAAKKTRKASRH